MPWMTLKIATTITPHGSLTVDAHKLIGDKCHDMISYFTMKLCIASGFYLVHV